MRKMFYTLGMCLFLSACGGTSDISRQDKPELEDKPGSSGGNVKEVVNVTSSLSVDLTTNKACYLPGENVIFTSEDAIPSEAKIRYRSMGKLIAEQTVSGNTWTWQAPSTDFTGYLVDVYKTQDDGTEVVLGTIGVDVSSDWTRFPRYGFVATFDASKKKNGVIEEEMAFLNRCHINGVQFQDWHNKHHWPLGGMREQLDDVYKDIANRDVYTEVIKKYIDVQHSYGMKSIFYNLCFGVLEDASADGIKDEWYIFKGTGRTDKDLHDLPDSWKSDIYLVNPANEEWQSYIAERNDDVYANFDFDGYQIDQLGSRGDRYDYDGNKINLPKGYASFIEAMKDKHPDKTLIMNAVSSYGASQIAGTGKVDFLYNETWADEASFKDLYTIIKANDQYSNYSLQTVFAAYMNYNIADKKGEFNIPGVLLTDAVIFALGGSHLELGDHMLCKEYFPNENLNMSSSLRTQIIRYYDFMTAYQNLLRGKDSSAETAVTLNYVKSGKNMINAWPPQQGKIASYAKNVEGRQVIHLLNFINADELSWRDLNGTMPTPSLQNKMELELAVSQKISRIWTASPDAHAGASQDLTFEQKDGKVFFTLPSLKYWAMIVIES